jgi:hypothetical protein
LLLLAYRARASRTRQLARAMGESRRILQVSSMTAGHPIAAQNSVRLPPRAWLRPAAHQRAGQGWAAPSARAQQGSRNRCAADEGRGRVARKAEEDLRKGLGAAADEDRLARLDPDPPEIEAGAHGFQGATT